MIIIAILGVSTASIPMLLPIAFRFHKETILRTDDQDTRLRLAARLRNDLESVSDDQGKTPRSRFKIRPSPIGSKSPQNSGAVGHPNAVDEILLIDGRGRSIVYTVEPTFGDRGFVIRQESTESARGVRTLLYPGVSLSFVQIASNQTTAALVIHSESIGSRPRIVSLSLVADKGDDVGRDGVQDINQGTTPDESLDTNQGTTPDATQETGPLEIQERN